MKLTDKKLLFCGANISKCFIVKQRNQWMFTLWIGMENILVTRAVGLYKNENKNKLLFLLICYKFENRKKTLSN